MRAQLPGEGPGEETVVSLFSGRQDASQCCKKQTNNSWN